MSAVAFYYGTKGGTISVIGMLLFIFNFLQMLGLFIYVQVKVFDSEIRECRDATADKNSSFARQVDACLAYIIVQYLKLFILVSAVIFGTCCLKSKSNLLHIIVS